MRKPTRPKMRPKDRKGKSEDKVMLEEEMMSEERMMPGDEMIDTRTLEREYKTRPRARPDDMEGRAALERAMRGAAYDAEDMETQGYAGGGMVRGCKSAQVSGKGFKGTY